MVKRNVALLLALGVLLLLAAPVNADPADEGQTDASTNGDAGPAPRADEPQSADASPAQAPTDGSNGTETTSDADAQDGTGCRVAGTHINDPSVPMSDWVVLDPDGCLHRIIYRILTIPPTTVYTSIRQRLPV